MLDWGRRDLMTASGVSADTIKNIEHGNFDPRPETLEKILQAFARNGVQFIGAFAVAYFDRETIKHYLLMLHRIGIPIPAEIRKTAFTETEAVALNLVSPEAPAAGQSCKVAINGDEESHAGADDEKTTGMMAEADHEAE